MNYVIVNCEWNAYQGKYRYDFTCESADAIASITEDCAVGSTVLVTGDGSVYYYGCNGFCCV